MIYKRPAWLLRTNSRNLGYRNFLLIVSAVLILVSAVFLFIKPKTRNTTAQFRVIKQPITEPVNPETPASSGGSGGESVTKHTEVFLFTEADKEKPSKHQIFLYDSATGEKKQLTGTDSDPRKDSVKFNVNPKTSPNGKTIYFARKEKGASYFDICSMDVDGSNVKSLFSACSTNFHLSFDGKKIIYMNIFKNIVEYNVDGSGTKSHSFFMMSNFYDFPMISHSRKFLYYVVYDHSILDQCQIYRRARAFLHSDGYSIASFDKRITGIEISPDGNFFLITFGNKDLIIFDINTLNIRTISSDKGSKVLGATWSNDGKSIYWIRDSPYNSIAKLSFDGKSSEDIVPNFHGYFVSLKPVVAANPSDGGGGGGGGAAFLFYGETPKDGTQSFIFCHDLRNNTKEQISGKDAHFYKIGAFDDSDPKISHNGDTIAFCRKFSNDPLFYIYILNLDGSTIPSLTVSVKNCDFNFSSNDQSLIFSNQTGSISSYNISHNISGVKQVDLVIQGDHPVMTKDGKLLYYAQHTHTSAFNIYVKTLYHASADKPVKLGYTVGSLRDFKLSPDEKYGAILYEHSGNTCLEVFELNDYSKLSYFPFLGLAIKDFFWSNDGKWLYIARGAPENDLIRISTVDYKQESLENILDNFTTPSRIALMP